jgi:ATP-dependent DNA helicase PIF1
MTYYPRYKERWFNVKLRRYGAYCVRYYKKDYKKRDDELFYYSAENHLDFGTILASLP